MIPFQADVNFNKSRNSIFPNWVKRKIGEPLFTETDWNYPAFPNSKFGIIKTSTGSLARDTTNLFDGGLGSILLTTAAISGDNIECKYDMNSCLKVGDLLAFEQKWNQNFSSPSTKFYAGIEARDNSVVWQSRFMFTINNASWQMETQTSGVYADFDPSVGGKLNSTKPVIDLVAGSNHGYTRIVIDPFNKKYVGFEASGVNSLETRDLRPLNLTLTNTGASSLAKYLFFVYVTASGANAEPAYSTDWCISRIPAGTEPF